MTNIYGRQVVVPLTNKSGGGVIAGDVVIVDTSNDAAFTTTTSGGFTGVIGVAQETIANNATGRVLTAGYAALVNVNASVTRGQYGKTHTVAKQATGTASRGVGTFCQWLTGGTTPTAMVYPPDLNASAGNVATDAIWDAAGDLAVGSGADTAARLAKGAAGANLSTYNGAVAWNGGTSFPASPASGDRYWRSDLNQEFFYNGTRWLGTRLERLQLGANYHYDGSVTTSISATTSPYDRAGAPYLAGGSDIWLETLVLDFFIFGGGTALGASHKWVYSFIKRNVGGDSTVTTISVDSGSSAVFRQQTASIGALANNGTSYFVYQGDVAKTGTPGNFEGYAEILYRIVAT